MDSNQWAAEFGLGDNWPILLNAKYDEVIDDLIGSRQSDSLFRGQYEVFQILTDDYINVRFNYVPGTVVIQVMNIIGVHSGLEMHELEKIYRGQELEHAKRQQLDFNMSLCMHPYQKRKVKDGSFLKAMAVVITDIARYAQKKRLPLCFPHSAGGAHENDFSRTVYFYPGKSAIPQST